MGVLDTLGMLRYRYENINIKNANKYLTVESQPICFDFNILRSNVKFVIPEIILDIMVAMRILSNT